MNRLREQIKIDFKKPGFEGSICMFHFMDNGHHIAYMPSLNLTGYGDSEEEAKELLMEHVVKDFFGWFNLHHHSPK